ncbi:MAG: NfeD family protein [Xanthobacteraceae bacterium]|nr:NfeD family protein [Xanthobacteraceae bacterium]QYK44651.1 MAG: NfeD family protein [Xanthobacteraceae bacterium]HMN51521.1 NfeD family protein [Xanthobacteraceae bacterium]
MNFLAQLGNWNWFIAGGILLALEVMLPGTYMLWLGLAAIATGVIGWIVSLTWQVQIVIFAILSVVSVLLGRRFYPTVVTATDKPFLNRRADAFVGRIFTLDEPIVSGSGRVRIDDSTWRVTGPDCPAGSKVRVTQADGASLIVEKA